MSNYNSNITDKEIRELLKRRLLEQNEDDLLTKNLIEMEAKIAFANEPLLAPSLHREQELITKLNNKFSSNILKKWMLGALGLVLIILCFLMIKNNFSPDVKITGQPLSNTVSNNNAPQKFHQNQLSEIDTSNENVSDVIPLKSESKVWPKEIMASVENETAGKFDEGPKHFPEENLASYENSDPYHYVPILTPKEIKENNKYKGKIIRHLYGCLKIPKGTLNHNGESVLLDEFYISQLEVTNKKYRTFINDLLIQNRMEDYLKALPDTTKRFIEGKTFLDPNNYFWKPVYDEYPVVNISREAALLYCKWLKEEMDGQNKKANEQIFDVRLPFDTEWIYAAQGGLEGAIYPWQTAQTTGIQNAKGCFLCNFSTNTSKFEIRAVDECLVKISEGITTAGAMTKGEMIIAPSVSYNPNNYGLYNMSGNVAEMICNSKTKKAGTKGGSWKSDCNHVKINAEDEYEGIIEASPFIGFRPVFIVKNVK